MRTERLQLIAPAWLLVMTLALVAAPAEVIVDGRPTVVLESPAAKLVIDLGGGSIVDFHFAASGLNPLDWSSPTKTPYYARWHTSFVLIDGVNPRRRNCATECRFTVKRVPRGG